MSPAPQLAPPGSSTYNSRTQHVGDGTWDAGRDNFLLPPLQGLNFATMRYNGMGNRFFTLTGYHAVVKAHGIVAAITFLFLLPAAILVMRFGGRRPRLARQLHIWIQVLVLLLSTVVLILGAFAVGPSRALSNPHHGIGVAIYTLIWIQVLLGCLVHRAGQKRRQRHIPLRAMLHHWLGRAIALLGLAQVPLGLTLYGSPLSLFVLYAIWVTILLVLYFILQWMHERRRSDYDSQHGSYVDEDVSHHGGHRTHGGGLGKAALAGAAGLGLAALFRRRSSGRRPDGSDVSGTGTGTSYDDDDEKFSEPAPRRTGWGQRLLQIGAIGGGIAAARKMFGGTRQPDDASVSDAGHHRPPLGGNQSVVTDPMSGVGGGRPPARPVTPTAASPGPGRPSHPLAQPPMTPGSGRRQSDDEYSYYSYMSGSPSRQGRHQTFRQAMAAGGAMYAVRTLFKHRQERKNTNEERRAESLRRQRVEQERIQRMDSAHRYTGDGVTPPRRARHHHVNSQTASDMSASVDGSILPGGSGAAMPAVGAGAGAAAAAALANRNQVRPAGTDPVIAPPGPASALPGNVPPVPPPHGPDFHSSGSELYTTPSGRPQHRHPLEDAGLAGAAVGAAASRRRPDGPHTDSIESQPVSLKVKMHNDGRHVTLRRLTEAEAAAQREARRQERQASATRRRRTSSLSNSSVGDELGSGSADHRWRRTAAVEAQQAMATPAAATSGSFSPMPGPSTSGPIYPTPPPPGTQHAIPPSVGLAHQLPLPPPIPASTSNLGPAGSANFSGTETSGATEYANNRRRRRAERAHARLAREGRTGNTVDFT